MKDSIMAVKLKYIRSIDYLQSTPEGEIDFEKSKELLVEIARAKRPPADFDIIMDFRRSQLKLSTSDIWYMAKELQNHDNVFRDKIAVLILPGLDFDKAEFFELCSKNRGFNVDVFSNYEDAIQWFHE